MVRSFLLSTAAVLATPAVAQTAPAPAPDPVEVTPIDESGEDEEEAIVITGQRERGAVIGDIPPENQLSARDIRAYGASSITELLADLAPQTGSARGRGGGQPVVLLNGRRISGFGEIRDLPPEAIFRIDILPEEVALKYGYRADQRVVNFVLRPRFRSTATRLEGDVATEGGRIGGEFDVTRLLLQENGRVSLNAHVERSSALTEAERDIRLADDTLVDDRRFRTLVGAREQYRLGGTVNRTILGDVSATVDGRVERVTGRSLFGADLTGLDPLERNTTTDSGRLGFALNGNRDRWRWSADGGYEVTRSLTRSDRDEELVEPRDRARTLNRFGEVTLVANGPLAELPAGRANVTLRLSGDTRDLEGEARRGLTETSTDLGRDRVGAAVNVDLPVAKRNGALSALGNLSVNANAEVERLSHFGTLTTLGGGLVWSPVQRLNLIASVTREEGAPGLTQLGDPVLETPGTRIFDFVTGQAVEVTAITGGNPELRSDQRTIWKLGGTWQPFEKTDLDLRFDYTRSRLKDPVSTFPGPSEAIEAAFPERFTRDASGQLVRVDLRPVNFERADRDTLRWGFNFQKPLRSARPTAAQIEQLRARAGLPRREPRSEGASSGREGGAGAGQRRGGGGGFGRFGGGRQGGRLQLSVFHTVTLKDEVRIRPGLPVLDYLDGEALDGNGGRPRHQLELEGGYFNNGLGARLSANWRSGTEIEGGENGNLRFSPLTRVNLRLFANLGERFNLVAKAPWLRGAQVRFGVDNIFDAKPRVRGAGGVTPLNYQSDLLDPLGRTVSISIRKLFLPPRLRQRPAQQPGS
ncbi:TonB-dependent receptor [Sphingomonas arenae]|uniref:TonB-dependent receptor n=1 Tax=Sphingomonas arenae TaxID=2812555 RepID=UPI001966F9BE|nr:TonB-dependent receptor [Sphingomonas arenae]